MFLHVILTNHHFTNHSCSSSRFFLYNLNNFKLSSLLHVVVCRTNHKVLQVIKDLHISQLNIWTQATFVGRNICMGLIFSLWPNKLSEAFNKKFILFNCPTAMGHWHFWPNIKPAPLFSYLHFLTNIWPINR